MKILIVSDAWLPQTNGVITTLAQTAAWLARFGHEVRMVTSGDFAAVPCPTYREIRLVVFPYRKMAQHIRSFNPNAIHIATEGPLGWAARRFCINHGIRFTTSYHTQFPEYLNSRFPIPVSWSYPILRRFHGAGVHCMVSTPTMTAQLAKWGFGNLVRWRRGVDTQLFRPRDKEFLQLPRPIAVCVGRVAIEKNIEAFLSMPWQGSKIVIGDGPELGRLRASFTDAHFTGFLFGDALAAHLAASDVMVFPSLTDTFGLVNLEAMACGVPVAAFPVTGPIDVVQEGVTGALDTNLARAALRALDVDPRKCREHALQSGWDACAREFEGNLVPCQGRNTFWRAPVCPLTGNVFT
jgi:glycosyltransferase involved in cell wall biosynthesis